MIDPEQKRLLNRFEHLGGQIAAAHVKLAGMAPSYVRDVANPDSLADSLEREWAHALSTSEALQARIQSLGDALKQAANGAPVPATQRR